MFEPLSGDELVVAQSPATENPSKVPMVPVPDDAPPK
jgi:hypothetical protein